MRPIPCTILIAYLRKFPWIKDVGVHLSSPAHEGHPEAIYFDTAMDVVIEKHHMFDDRFFAYLMKQTDLWR